MNLIKIKTVSKKLLKYYTLIAALFFTIFIILSFTTIPFWMYYYLGISSKDLKKEPDYIIVLGGGGMPSESGLMRTYFASRTSKQFTNSKLIVTLPGDTTDKTSAVFLMKKELIERGVDEQRILFEPVGTNTRSQALEIKKLIDTKKNILLISSPEHIYRAVKTFIKVGFKNTCGKPAFENAIESQLSYNDNELGGNKIVPDIGNNTQLRYQFWNHMKYQIIVYREYLAIVYYKLKSWI